jgi:hypothetical protein
MRLNGLEIANFILITALGLSLLSCASTKISSSWVDPDHSKTYGNLLVIGVSESEQNRRAYESYFTEELDSRGVDAIASYKLIKSNVKIDRDSMTKATEGIDIDGVIITHVLAVDEETIYRPSMDYTPVYSSGYYGGLYSYYPHVHSYVQRPGYYTTHEIYTIETNLYDIDSEDLVWSARTRTFSPGSVDEVIEDLTRLLIKDLADKKLISTK